MDRRRIEQPYYVYFWWIALIAVAGVLLYLLSPILTPFLFSALLAYMFNPLVEKLSTKMPRTLSVVVVMLLIICILIGLIVILFPVFEKQASTLMQQLPSYIEWVRAKFAPWIKEKFGIELHMDMEYLRGKITENMQSASGLAISLLPALKSGGASILGFFVSLSLIPVVLFYFLRDWERILKHIEAIIPRRWHPQITSLAKDIDAVLGEFFRGQISVMVVMSIIYALSLWIIGLDFALPIGLVAGILAFIPYLGVVIGATLATLAGLVQFQDLTSLVWIWLVFAVGQTLDGWFITPRVIGNRIGLHPVAVIFALMAFGQLFGFFGILLALPASAALLVWFRQLRKKYIDSDLYKS